MPDPKKFNLDYRPRNYWGPQEVEMPVGAILDMGFADCMRKFCSSPIQTHRNPRSKFPWELDHMFATEELFDCLTQIDVPDASALSDHDPIIADFDLSLVNQ